MWNEDGGRLWIICRAYMLLPPTPRSVVTAITLFMKLDYLVCSEELLSCAHMCQHSEAQYFLCFLKKISFSFLPFFYFFIFKAAQCPLSIYRRINDLDQNDPILTLIHFSGSIILTLWGAINYEPLILT